MATKTITGTRVPAKEAKNRFGELLEAVQRHPIIITKNNRPVAELRRISEKTRFEEAEDRVWGERALRAEKEGTIGVVATRKLMQRFHNARTRPR
jgi:prevent-host-death family protein